MTTGSPHPGGPADWPTGQVRQFFFYHQMANSYLYQIKCNSIKNGQGLPSIECVQVGRGPGQGQGWCGVVQSRRVGCWVRKQGRAACFCQLLACSCWLPHPA